MRPVARSCLVIALSIIPRLASAQLSVTSPAAGAAGSYRTATISWNPIPSAASYHLEIDDDPNFGSPEVDVTVSGTSYTLNGQRLKLNGRPSAAAYVRINGTRWNANTFTPTYLGNGQKPALGIDSANRVYLAFHGDRTRVQLAMSSDWSDIKRLSLADTYNADRVNFAIDEFDVAHAFWLEQRPEENRVPYYTSSSTAWSLMRIPGTTPGCSDGASFAAGATSTFFSPAMCRTKSVDGQLRMEPSSLERPSQTARMPTAQALIAMRPGVSTLALSEGPRRGAKV
jgi:hypothetical protein